MTTGCGARAYGCCCKGPLGVITKGVWAPVKGGIPGAAMSIGAEETALSCGGSCWTLAELPSDTLGVIGGMPIGLTYEAGGMTQGSITMRCCTG